MVQVPTGIGVVLSKVADGVTELRKCKPSEGPSLTCVSGTALTRRCSQDAFDLWSLQIMLCWGWFSQRKLRQLNIDYWRVCLVYPKLDKTTQQHCHSDIATLTGPESPVHNGRLWQILGHETHSGQGRTVFTEAGKSTHRSRSGSTVSVQREAVISGASHLSPWPTWGHYRQGGQKSAP